MRVELDKQGYCSTVVENEDKIPKERNRNRMIDL